MRKRHWGAVASASKKKTLKKDFKTPGGAQTTVGAYSKQNRGIKRPENRGKIATLRRFRKKATSGRGRWAKIATQGPRKLPAREAPCFARTRRINGNGYVESRGAGTEVGKELCWGNDPQDV